MTVIIIVLFFKKVDNGPTAQLRIWSWQTTKTCRNYLSASEVLTRPMHQALRGRILQEMAQQSCYMRGIIVGRLDKDKWRAMSIYTWDCLRFFFLFVHDFFRLKQIQDIYIHIYILSLKSRNTTLKPSCPAEFPGRKVSSSVSLAHRYKLMELIWNMFEIKHSQKKEPNIWVLIVSWDSFCWTGHGLYPKDSDGLHQDNWWPPQRHSPEFAFPHIYKLRYFCALRVDSLAQKYVARGSRIRGSWLLFEQWLNIGTPAWRVMVPSLWVPQSGSILVPEMSANWLKRFNGV